MSLSRLFFYNVNISNGSIIATHNSNTVGNIFTTGGNIGIDTSIPSTRLHVNGSSLISGNMTIGSNLIVTGPTLKIPTGNISSRPVAPENGSIRYNTETSQFEGYGPGGAWGSLGGVVDIAQTTKILASETPSTTDGNLYFYTIGSERMRINSSGNIGIGTSNPSVTLDIVGTAKMISLDTTNLTTTNLIATNFTASNFLANNINYGISSIFSGSFSANNNVIVPSNIIGFNFVNENTRSFQANVTISLLRNSGGNLYQTFIFDGFQTDSGWFLYTSNIGDETGIQFSITPQGQIQYTSSNISNFTSNTIRFSVSQISNTGNYSFSGNLTQGTLLIDSIQIQNTRNSIVGTDPGSFQVLGGSTFSKGINILTTDNTIGLGTGGCLTVLGGAAISKDLYVGGTITVGNLEVNSLIDATTISASNLHLSNNLNVAGTLTVVNITATNLMDTNLTAGIARITSNLAAVGNSNTLGNIFTTGANIGIGTTSPSRPLDIIGIIKATGLEINDVTNAFMPRGGIIMWSGSIASIPTGWLICDGTNGTPDLRGRFIIGSNISYTQGSSGGSATKTLTTANIPAHNHNFNFYINAGTGSASVKLNAGVATDNWTTHTTTTDSQGSGTAFDILPPYYSLAFIMKA